MKLFLFAFLAVIAVAATVTVYRAFRTYLKFRGKRIVSCPENHLAAAVVVSAAKAAMESTIGTPHLALSECSRWPERAGCGQECLAQTIVNEWYAGKACVYCHTPFHEIHWHDHPPALLDEENRTIEWKEIPAEHLQQTFRTHLPVCWNCHIAQTFRRVHSDLVVNRPLH